MKIVDAARITPEDLVIEIGPGIGTLTRLLCEKAGQVLAVEIDRDLVAILKDTLRDCPNLRVIEGDVLKTDLASLSEEYGIARSAGADENIGQQIPAGQKASVSDTEEKPDSVSAGCTPPPGTSPSATKNPADSYSYKSAEPVLYNRHPPCNQLKIAANLPYYITTPILMNLFEQDLPVDRIVVMVQKEVAERMTAPCGTRSYGSLSLAVQYYSRPEIITVVPASDFLPRPKVDSAVIAMDVYRQKPVTASDEGFLKKIVRAAFSQRRKTLANALGSAPQIPCSREDVISALASMGLSSSVRGEALSLEQFAELTSLLTAFYKTDVAFS